MRVPWRKPVPIVASATAIRTQKDVAEMRKAQSFWQPRALSYYETVGELRFSAQFYARMMARVRFFPGTMDGNEIKPIEDGPPVDLLNRIHDQGGRPARVQYDYGRLMFITGEGFMFVTGEGTEDERWRFLWRDELAFDESNQATVCKRDASGAITDQCGKAYRMWTSAPRNSEWADSPFRSVLDIAEELVLLTASVRSTAVSRLTKGILLLPSEASPPPLNPGKDEDPNSSPFLQAFVEHLQAQIENPGSAPANSPYLLEASYEYLDQVRWLQVNDPKTDYLERDLRLEAIKRLAIALDFPPEVLLGMSESNHWTAQQVQWDMWRAHGVPLAEQYANDVNSAILRPAMRLAEYDGWEDLVIGYDDSQVVVSPDQTSIADEAWDRANISDEGYRKLKGIPESMKPSEKEREFVFGIKTRDPVVAGLEEQAPPVHGPQPGPAVGQNGQSNVPPQPTQGRVVSRQEARVASILGAAHMAIRQCRSKAGARLRTTARNGKRCDECHQLIEDLPNAVVASALNAAGVLKTMSDRDPINLVAGGTDDFKGILAEWGIDPANAGVLCERLEAHAAATLFHENTPDVPPGYAAHVEHALQVADREVVA